MIELDLDATGNPVRGRWLGRPFRKDNDEHCCLRSYIINETLPLHFGQVPSLRTIRKADQRVGSCRVL